MPARWALPFKYQELLTAPQALKVLGGAGASIGWGLVMVAIAAFILKKRDI
jgi:hypothetical protein